jgi:hypothetical protein
MLRSDKAVSEASGARSKKPYRRPELISRGDILELTLGGGPLPVNDAQGTGGSTGTSS